MSEEDPRAVALAEAGRKLQELKAAVGDQEEVVAAAVVAARGVVTPTEAARLTGLSRPTIYKLMREE